MAHLTVRFEAFERGEFPMVCCKTGRPADYLVEQEFVYVPPWTWILIFFGFFPFLIARAFGARRFVGTIPMSERADLRIRRASRTAALSMIFGIVLLFAGFLAVMPLAAAGLFFLAVSIVAFVVGRIWMPGAWPDDHYAVELTRVHPRFVEAVRGHVPAGS